MSKLIWSEEFDYEGEPDPKKWSHQLGYNKCNHEKQLYTDSIKNSRVEHGKLIIESLFDDEKYTSARLHTKGNGDWKYGRIEVSAKMPYGRGTWPAIWLMPTDSVYGGWPNSGEIDIMEHVGRKQGEIFCTNHCSDRLNCSTKLHIDDCSEKFHTYAIEWTEDKITGYVDEQVTHTYINKQEGYKSWPYDQKFHLIVNLAIGGTLGGFVDNSIFPQRMEIEHVRVYSL